MRINKLKDFKELATYQSAEAREAASKEELHEALVSFDQYITALSNARKEVFYSLQDKMCKSEQLSLDFGAYTYEVKKEVKKKFLNDFATTEDEAKLLEDLGFDQFVSRTEEVVNKLKIDRTNLKKAYLKNTLPEAVSSHYKFDEETKLNVLDPKEITVTTEEE